MFHQRRRGRRGSRGQSIVEFALILPMLMLFFGATVDFARVFQTWIALESATRDAAEAAAMTATTSSEAATIAQSTICTQASGLPGYVANGGGCSQPAVAIGSFTRSTTAPGATTKNPIATVTVTASMPFRALFSYPLFTQNGAWTVRASATYAIVQGR